MAIQRLWGRGVGGWWWWWAVVVKEEKEFALSQRGQYTVALHTQAKMHVHFCSGVKCHNLTVVRKVLITHSFPHHSYTE